MLIVTSVVFASFYRLITLLQLDHENTTCKLADLPSLTPSLAWVFN